MTDVREEPQLHLRHLHHLLLLDVCSLLNDSFFMLVVHLSGDEKNNGSEQYDIYADHPPREVERRGNINRQTVHLTPLSSLASNFHLKGVSAVSEREELHTVLGCVNPFVVQSNESVGIQHPVCTEEISREELHLYEMVAVREVERLLSPLFTFGECHNAVSDGDISKAWFLRCVRRAYSCWQDMGISVLSSKEHLLTQVSCEGEGVEIFCFHTLSFCELSNFEADTLVFAFGYKDRGDACCRADPEDAIMVFLYASNVGIEESGASIEEIEGVCFHLPDGYACLVPHP